MSKGYVFDLVYCFDMTSVRAVEILKALTEPPYSGVTGIVDEIGYRDFEVSCVRLKLIAFGGANCMQRVVQSPFYELKEDFIMGGAEPDLSPLSRFASRVMSLDWGSGPVLFGDACYAATSSGFTSREERGRAAVFVFVDSPALLVTKESPNYKVIAGESVEGRKRVPVLLFCGACAKRVDDEDGILPFCDPVKFELYEGLGPSEAFFTWFIEALD